jgi:hypothetical protein
VGARCNFVFKQSENMGVALYSHWGETNAHGDLAAALKHASPRKGDESYYIRMAISYLIQDSVLDETGFGIYAINPNDLGFIDYPIVIDLVNHTVSDISGTHDIDKYIEYHLASLV